MLIVEAAMKPYAPIKDADEFGDGHAAEKISDLLENRNIRMEDQVRGVVVAAYSLSLGSGNIQVNSPFLS